MNFTTPYRALFLVLVLVFFQTGIVFAQTVPMDMTPPSDATPPMEETTPPAPEMPAGPTVSNVSVKNITDNSAEVDVDSDEVVQGYVEYGTSEQYGMSTPLTAEFSTSPSFILENLLPETLYHYRVIVMDSAGNVAITSDATFTTLATPVPEPTPEPEPETSAPPATTTPTITATSTSQVAQPTEATSTSPMSAYPTISNVAVNPVATSTAIISWTTSQPATSDIQYGTTTSYVSSVGNDQTLQTSHSRTLSGLSPATLYHFRIVATDSAGNVALGKDRTFNTTAIIPSVSAELTVSVLPTVVVSSQGAGGLPVVPMRPLLLIVAPLDGQVSFEWLKDAGVKNGDINTVIVKKQGTSPVRSRTDGNIIYDGPSTTFTDTDVQNGVEYHYALYSYGAFGRFTSASNFKVVPQANAEEIDIPAAQIAKEATPLPIFSRDLFRGTQGDDVTELQTYLSEYGYYPEGLITGYFGPLTVAAVIRFQTLNNISPAFGYFGPISKEFLAQ